MAADEPPKERPAMLKVGDPVPAFRLKDHTGKDRTLAEFRGKRVVLWFYPKANTGGWTAEGCGFRDLTPEYEKKGAVILGISFDTPEENASFVAKQSFPFPLLTDVDRAAAIAFGAAADAKAAYPKRITVVIGPDGKVERIIDKVDARAHPADLLQALPAAGK
jgi:thioredoxin-dependent peroxiredoxin